MRDAIVVKDVCPKCFQGRMFGGVCPKCGFVPEMEELKPLALPYQSILKKQYVTGKVLGVGGFGITYIALDAGSGRLCCIKEYCPTEYVRTRDDNGRLECKSGVSKDFEEGKVHFLDEAEILSELKENVTVVDAWDSFEENNTAYYVMELLKGENLRQYRLKHELSAVKAVTLQMLLVIGDALGEIHRYGLMHGDISPENIIVTETHNMKLIDFGTARAISKSPAEMGRTVYLKPSYAPLEMYTLDNKQGPWSDVYSLAATYYATVSGVKVIDAQKRAQGSQYTPLYQMNLGIDKALSDVIDHALALDYHDRYQSMKEFMQEISRVTQESDLGSSYIEISGDTQVLSRNVLNEFKESAAELSMVSKEMFGWKKKKKRTFQYLEFLEGDRVIRRWHLEADKELSMGRHPDSDIMTPSHNMISRRHCKLTYISRTGEFMLEDAGSMYGTFQLNGQRLNKGMRYTLKDGDKFYLYAPRFTFRVVIEK